MRKLVRDITVDKKHKFEISSIYAKIRGNGINNTAIGVEIDRDFISLLELCNEDGHFEDNTKGIGGEIISVHYQMETSPVDKTPIEEIYALYDEYKGMGKPIRIERTLDYRPIK